MNGFEQFRSRELIKAVQWNLPVGIMIVMEDRRAADKSSPVNVNPGDWMIFGTFDEREGVVSVMDDKSFKLEYEPLPKAACYTKYA